MILSLVDMAKCDMQALGMQDILASCIEAWLSLCSGLQLAECISHCCL